MDKLCEIFQRQAVYVTALTPTYLSNGFEWHNRAMPWDLSNRKAQEEFRLLAWRFTEEVIEAQETYENVIEKKIEQYHEEVADALHFFIELCLATDVLPLHLVTGTEDGLFIGDKLDEIFAYVKGSTLQIMNEPWPDTIRALALAMMNLRQRPWRTDFRETNRARWILGMHLTFKAFVNACIQTNISSKDLYKAYFTKSKVNDIRIAQYGVLPHGYSL